MATLKWVAELDGVLLGAFATEYEAVQCELEATNRKILIDTLMDNGTIEEIKAAIYTLPESSRRMQLFARLMYLEDNQA